MTRALVLALLLSLPVHAAPPPGVSTDSAIARWVHSTRDYRGVGCCDLADCRQTAVRLNAAGAYEAWIGSDEYGS